MLCHACHVLFWKYCPVTILPDTRQYLTPPSALSLNELDSDFPDVSLSLFPLSKAKNGCPSRLMMWYPGLIRFTLMLTTGQAASPPPYYSSLTRVVSSRKGRLATSWPTAFESANLELVTIDERSSIVHCYGGAIPFSLMPHGTGSSRTIVRMG